MTNFKGTRGKWIYTNHIHSSQTHDVHRIDSNLGIAICVLRTNNLEQKMANALLISKAPEMLDMLNEILYDNSDIQDLLKRAKQLIKEATEL